MADGEIQTEERPVGSVKKGRRRNVKMLFVEDLIVIIVVGRVIVSKDALNQENVN